MSTTNGSSRHQTRRLRVAAVLAALGTLIMASGLVVLSAPAASANGNGASNQADYWETEVGETCEKVDDTGASSGGYRITESPMEGYSWSKIVIKKGSGTSQGEENTVIDDPVTGQTYLHFSGSGYSHVILCQVPTPTYDECPEIDGDQPEGTDCVAPADKVERRTVTQDPDCEAGTVTTLFQERTRSYAWDGDSFEPGPWSEWETVETSVKDATEQQCPQGEEVEVPDAPVPAAPDCDTDGSLALPADDEAFVWTVLRADGEDTGTAPYGPGVYDVTVESLLGEFVGGGTTRTFEDVTVLAATGEGEGCVLGVEEIAPAVDFTDPTCARPGAAAWSGELTEVVDYTASRPAKAGTSLTVTAAIRPELADEFAFAGGVQTVFTHAYPSLEDLDCVKGVESFAPAPKPDAERPPTVLGTQAAVPTAVDAGLTGTRTGDAASSAGVVGQLLVAGGLLLLLAGGWVGLGRRDRGAHTA